MISYNDTMKIHYYSEGDLEILDENSPDPLLYFEDVEDLATLIKTSPRLAITLKGLL